MAVILIGAAGLALLALAGTLAVVLLLDDHLAGRPSESVVPGSEHDRA